MRKGHSFNLFGCFLQPLAKRVSRNGAETVPGPTKTTPENQIEDLRQLLSPVFSLHDLQFAAQMRAFGGLKPAA